jgi:hypothetical protein
VDNRGRDLFVMLTYPREITSGFRFTVDGEAHVGLDQDVAFVALKNGEHSGVGYFIDTGESRPGETMHFPLSELPERIMDAFGLRRLQADAGHG